MSHAFMSPSAFKTAKECPAAPLRQFQVNQRIDLLRLAGAHFYGLNEESDINRWNQIMAEDNNPADDGTKLHTVFETSLENGIAEKDDIRLLVEEQDLQTDMKGDEFILDELTNTINEQLVDLESASRIGIEEKVQILGLPQHGTIDLAFVEGKTLYLRDLKTGRVEVSSENNDQLMNYGVGIMDKWDLWDDIDTIEMQILGIRFKADKWSCTAEDLMNYKNDVMLPAFMEAYKINPVANAGDHCLYCSAKIHCPEWMEKFNGVANEHFENDFSDIDDTEELENIWITLKQADRALKECGRELMSRMEGFYEPKRVATVVRNRKDINHEMDVDEVMKKAKIKKSEYTKTEVISAAQLKSKFGDDLPEGLIVESTNAPYLKIK